MRFKYIAAEPSGRIINGTTEAGSPAEVLEFIVGKGLRPVSVKSLGGADSKVKGVFSQAVSIEDKVFLTKYLALMLKVGTDLFKAIDILIADFDKPSVKAILIEIKESIAKGQPFYSTFIKYPKYFSPVFVNLIKAGEASGNLDKTFEDLSKTLEKEQALRSKIKAALIYPLVLVTLAFTIMFLLVSFALPKIAEVFTSGGTVPPTFSRVVFAIGLFMGKYVLIIIPIILGSVTGAFLFARTVIGKRFIARSVSRLPIIGNVAKRIAIQRFAFTLASLLRSGMPIVESIEITADAVGSQELRAALLRVSRDGITKGLTIGEAFQRETYFPRVVVNLIAISEKAGHIDQLLETLADFYETEIDSAIKTILSLMEPALLVVIGGLVAIIALAIIIPIFQLTASI